MFDTAKINNLLLLTIYSAEVFHLVLSSSLCDRFKIQFSLEELNLLRYFMQSNRKLANASL